VNYNKPGDRVLTEHDYQAIKKAIEKVAEASDDLTEGLKALDKAFGVCCIHLGGGGGDPSRHKRLRVMRKRAS
jgi:hypothetical protein